MPTLSHAASLHEMADEPRLCDIIHSSVTWEDVRAVQKVGQHCHGAGHEQSPWVARYRDNIRIYVRGPASVFSCDVKNPIYSERQNFCVSTEESLVVECEALMVVEKKYRLII